jgi:hypothetical protein
MSAKGRPMFFLFRCIFWLGLVFSQIGGQESFSLGSGFDPFAGRSARQASDSVAGLGQAAMMAGISAAGRQCRVDTEKCLALAAQAARLSQAASPSRLQKSASPSSATPSRDTLTAGDRAPAWRLRSATNEAERTGKSRGG